MKNQAKLSNICDKCNKDLTPVKLYSPELLGIFIGGNKRYNKNGILTEWLICLNNECEDGKKNILSYTEKKQD
jgi:hypothetical protein